MSKFLKVLIGGLFFTCAISQANAFPNFDHDGKADFAVFRPSDSNWYSYSSEQKSFSSMNWGLLTDRLVPADYDGDGLTDHAVWRAENGNWYIRQSSNGKYLFANWGTKINVPGGSIFDEPTPADYDGDGLADIAVWRASTGIWYVLKSSENFNVNKAQYFSWGKLGDIAVPADYDGDGKADFAVFRYTENRWYIFQSLTQTMRVSQFGNAGYDLLVPADYTGDGKTDIAVYRRGIWYFQRSEDGQSDYFQFGAPNDIPVPADYDNDGETDFAVYRNGTWFITESSNGNFTGFNFGTNNDIPIASLGVKQSIIGVP